MADGSTYSSLSVRADILSPMMLVDLARRQSFFAPSADTLWLTSDPSAIALQLFAAENIGNKCRDFGNILELTHYAESAVAIYGLRTRALKGTDPSENAYILYAHDFMEMLAKKGVTEEEIILKTWHGDPARIPFLLIRLKEFTDTPDLHLLGRDQQKLKKLQEQVERAHESNSPLYANGRFVEKRETFKRDLYNIENGLMSFATQDDADIYIKNKLLPRVWVIDNLPIERRFKREFNLLNREIQTAITRQLRPNMAAEIKHVATTMFGQIHAPEPGRGASSLIQRLRAASLTA